MRAGRRRHRVTIERPEQTQDPVTGEIQESWVEVSKAWVSIEHLSAREFVAAKAGQTEISARIGMRYREGIDASMRINHKGTIYNIEGVLPDPVSGRQHMTLPVSTGVNDG